MEDLKNGYLNEQGLRQERDALRAENARLRRLLKKATFELSFFEDQGICVAPLRANINAALTGVNRLGKL